MLFSGDAIPAHGVVGSLMTERKESGRISVSAQFKMDPGAVASDEDGRDVRVGGQTLTWFSTVTEKTRKRTIESMVLAGLSEAVANKMIEMAEAGKTGKTSNPAFGSAEVSLKCKIDEYEGKTRTKIEWVNEPGGRRSKAAAAEELDFGDLVTAPTKPRDADDPYA